MVVTYLVQIFLAQPTFARGQMVVTQEFLPPLDALVRLEDAMVYPLEAIGSGLMCRL